MRDFRKRGSRSPLQRFFLLLGGLLCVLAIAFFAVRAAWDMYGKFAVASRGNDGAQKEMAELEDQYLKITASVDALSTPRGQEGEIRERFGVGKPGEEAIEIVRAASSSSTGGAAAGQNMWSRIWNALFIW